MARKSFGPKTWVYPMPVFIIASYNDDGTPNAMNAAWGSIGDDDKIFICCDKTHKTTDNILKRKAFTVSMATESTMVSSDYVGIVSGKDVPDKFARSGWHATRSDLVDAPLIDELPMSMECEFISYEPKTSALFGKIVDVKADESILTDGKIDPKKLMPITYDPIGHRYYGLGEPVGNAFSDGKRLK
ncbi:MAG: flavin reductase family protein [Candidatus Methanomethylophilaceae archaeon]|nr:flavin reductase family protein [Candidatus Methanomethylophilaceae archaeon]